MTTPRQWSLWVKQDGHDWRCVAEGFTRTTALVTAHFYAAGRRGRLWMVLPEGQRPTQTDASEAQDELRCRDCGRLFPRSEEWSVFVHSTGLSERGFCATCGAARAILR